ncbi:putative MFS transporter [Pseudorhizobium banfieldiae]|uniref:Putative MFS transporter n=1 Tax=Pseudorhizobium banfieldiae TaxID=1125847 RepID=L0NF93_9HYPH|nr:MFS transporter [Pseudorhizobium banfieldiae]CAD6611215.1 MFS transporter [arsenite-oxidising bacterium NT-25]CCF19730.1 putative MFS transporter [Pseudorhizobium banfieldiae]
MTTRWSHVTIAVLGGVAAAVHVGKVPPALPLLRDELQLDLVAAGWLMGLVALMGGLLGLVMGRLADRVTHRRAMILSLVLLTCGSMAGLFAHSAAMLFASRIVEGFGLILAVVAAPALITSATEARDRGLAFAIWAAWLPVGVGGIMLVSPVLLPVYGWRGAWIAAALFTLIPLAALLLSKPVSSVTGATPPSSLLDGARLTVALPTTWLLGGMFLLYAASFMSVFGFLPTMLIEESGLALGTASVMTAIAVLANVPGNIAGGYLLRHGARRWALIVTAFFLLSLSAFVVFASELPLTIRYTAALLYAATGGLLPASIMSALPAYAARQDLVSTISGFIMQGTNLGQFLGPLLLAAVVSAKGWAAAPYYVAATALFGILLALKFRRREI